VTSNTPTIEVSAGARLASTLRAAAPLLVLLALLLLAPSVMSDFRLSLLGKFLCYAILAIGIDLAWGYTGMLSLGHGVWFGIGGYALAMHMKLAAAHDLGDTLPDFMTWTGLKTLPWFWQPFEQAWFSLMLVVLLPGLLAFLLGLLVFRSRVKGAYFSIITQALALSVSIFIIGRQEYSGGTNGLTSFTSLFGLSLARESTQLALYYATVATLVGGFVLARWVTHSPFGRLMLAIRDDEERVRFAGYNVGLVKAAVFGLSATFAGVAGALYAPQVGIISPANIDIVPSIEFVLFVAVGGRGTLIGPLVGALLVGGARSALSESFPDTWLYLYGGLFVGAVVLFPSGLVGIGQQLLDRLGAVRGATAPAARGAVPLFEADVEGAPDAR
jgi:urea transport system permease protein